MFKIIVLCVFIAAASAGSPFSRSQPVRHTNVGFNIPTKSYGSSADASAGSPFSRSQPVRHTNVDFNVPSKSYASSASSDDAHAEIKYLESDVHAEGFHYSFETTNGIKAEAIGNEHGDIKGEFEWISPEGEHVQVNYVADENGYQPSSHSLPTPPPVPVAILKSLEYIRNHPSQPEYHGNHH